MTVNQRAREFGHKAARRWDELNSRPGEEPFSLAHELADAWRIGFEAGKRQQVKTQNLKEMEMKRS